LPTVRQFNTDQKLLFRSRILALNIEIKNSSGQPPNYPTTYQNSINHNDPFYHSHQQQYSHFLPINSQIQQSSRSMSDTSYLPIKFLIIFHFEFTLIFIGNDSFILF